MVKNLKIGTRGSKLALWQANWVKAFLSEKFPYLSIELEIIKTSGDKITDVPLAKVGGKGLFVKEIEEALINGKIDLAVHSMKDMPADIPGDLCFGAVPMREDPRDVLISKQDYKLMDLAKGARIGTSSLRRLAQICHARPDFIVSPLRGNLDTRLKKLEDGHFDAIILAAAGVKRLNLENKITEFLDEKTMLPAVGQGALCVEIRKNDKDIKSIVQSMDHSPTRFAVSGERAYLKRLEGGCQVPIAGFGKIENDRFIITGLVSDIYGKQVVKGTLSGDYDKSEEIGILLADRLMTEGAGKILENLKTDIGIL